MKHKIIGIVMSILLISSTTAIAVTLFNRYEQQTKKQFFDTTSVPFSISKESEDLQRNRQ